MKFLIFAALLLATTAAAADTYTSRNTGGGEIVLTERECTVGNRTVKGLREAYTFNSTGETVEGCWTMQDGYVHVRWRNPDGSGTTRIYRIETFTKREAM